ncbi:MULTISPECIES: DNA starvation/stationary phase protection protein DpsA [Halococcus]|uniref:Ferritin n=1 Tax=Halococcus salifodinae DSM 8989 TaxID=1227456 RepID=M0MXH8_9EURY|nr:MULTISPECIES: DNA starvation/stationary phase protection protein DpsA [Halococcus]EMA50442.1 ferritin [Halococcus salifodinae DSM 8989]
MSAQKSDSQLQQEFGTVEESPALRIEGDRAEQIVDALNADLASSYVLYHQLKKHHWNVEGAEFLEVHRFLEEAYEAVEHHSDVIAERAQALGGVPIAGPEAHAEHSYVEFEGEDVYDVRTSLRSDMEMFADIIERMRDHIELTNNLGDYTSEEVVRGAIADYEEYAHHLEHYLEDDTLVLDEATH